MIPLPDFRGYDDLVRTATGPVRWVWHGYLTAGAVTLLTSRWKAGKTTLLSVLLGKLAGGGELAGAAVAAGTAAVVSEESPGLWVRRGAKLGFGPHLEFLCRPFLGKPSHDQWLGLVDRLADLHARRGLSLAVIDPLVNVLPGGDENSAAAMIAALAPLQRLTAEGVAVLLLHHPRKTSPGDDPEPRGSGALPGFVDVLMDLDGPRPGATTDRRRRLRAVSRFEETPVERLVALNQAGTDYDPVADAGTLEFTSGWEVLRMVLEDTQNKLTRKRILEFWPADFLKPSEITLWGWLDRAVATGLVAREGTGRRNDPFKYWLPEREEELNDFELPPIAPLEPLRMGRW